MKGIFRFIFVFQVNNISNITDKAVSLFYIDKILDLGINKQNSHIIFNNCCIFRRFSMFLSEKNILVCILNVKSLKSIFYLSENSLTIPLFCHMTAVPLCIEQSSTVHYLISCNVYNTCIYYVVLFQGSSSNSKIKGNLKLLTILVLSTFMNVNVHQEHGKHEERRPNLALLKKCKMTFKEKRGGPNFFIVRNQPNRTFHLNHNLKRKTYKVYRNENKGNKMISS